MERERERERGKNYVCFRYRTPLCVNLIEERERERDLEKIRETRLKYACSIQRTLTRLNEIL